MMVYVVMSGSYSSRCIDSIFSDQEKAETYIRHCATEGGTRTAPQDYEMDIEEHELDTIAEPLTSNWYVTIGEDGELAKWHFSKTNTNVLSPQFFSTPEYAEPPGTATMETDPLGFRAFKGWGTSLEHARRSAEELRRQTLALEGKVVTG